VRIGTELSYCDNSSNARMDYKRHGDCVQDIELSNHVKLELDELESFRVRFGIDSIT